MADYRPTRLAVAAPERPVDLLKSLVRF